MMQQRAIDALILIAKRYPLTSTSLTLFTAYTIASVLTKRIKRLFYSRRGTQSPCVPLDIQREVLNVILRESADREILPLTLVCKDWSRYIEENPLWFNERIYSYIEGKMVKRDRVDVDRFLNQLGDRQIFSPKIIYFLFTNRIKSSMDIEAEYKHLGEESPNRVRAGNASVREYNKQFKGRNLYVPWLNQSIVDNPVVLWKFLWTALRHPGGIKQFKQIFVGAGYKDSDDYHTNIIRKMVGYLMVPFGLLATADNIIYYSSSLFKALWRSPDTLTVLKVAFTGQHSWSLAAQVHAPLMFAAYQLCENSFEFPILPEAKLGLIFAMFALSRGLIVPISAGFLLLQSLIEKKLIPIKPQVANFIALVPTIYYYPLLAPLQFVLISAIVEDLNKRQHGPTSTFYAYLHPELWYLLLFLAPFFNKALM